MTQRRTVGGVAADKTYSATVDYSVLVEHLRQRVMELTPADATVLVASKGDPDLLSLGGRKAWHFPRSVNGEFAGFHPANSEDAILRLDALRQQGAGYLVVPSSSGWWSDYYPDFFAHLRSSGRSI